MCCINFRNSQIHLKRRCNINSHHFTTFPSDLSINTCNSISPEAFAALRFDGKINFLNKSGFEGEGSKVVNYHQIWLRFPIKFVSIVNAFTFYSHQFCSFFLAERKSVGGMVELLVDFRGFSIAAVFGFFSSLMHR